MKTQDPVLQKIDHWHKYILSFICFQFKLFNKLTKGEKAKYDTRLQSQQLS